MRLVKSIQRRFTKCIYDLRPFQLSFPSRLKFLGLNSLEMRRVKSDLIFLHKPLYKFYNLNSFDVLCFADFSTGTKDNGLELIIPHCNAYSTRFLLCPSF